jgi:hypothetical protein
MSLKQIVFIGVFALVGMTHAQAQCKFFTKKKCMPALAPYLSNGQLNTTSMLPGQTAEMLMNFNSGMSYRIIVCSEELLGTLEFQVTDATGAVLYSNQKDNYNDTWDFDVAQTSQLTLTVKVPDLVDKTRLMAEGCVSVLVGFRK